MKVNNQLLILSMAYYGIINIFCTLYYLLTTINVDTPFKDSLTNEQVKLLKISTIKRSKIYLEGLILVGVILFVIKPF